MRTARRSTLVAMLAIAAPALAAPSAFAQTEPELHNQAPRLIVAQEVHAASDVACPAVTPSPPPNPSPLVTAGGCRLHFSSTDETMFITHLSAGGIEVADETTHCDWEFDARIDSAGEGWLSHQELTGPSPPCIRQACAQATPPTGEGRAYTVYLRETEVAGQGPREEAIVLFCHAPQGDPTQASHCEVTLPLSQTSTHRYRLVANDVSGHGTAFPHCELLGAFDVEATLGTTGEAQAEQNIEVRHT